MKDNSIIDEIESPDSFFDENEQNLFNFNDIKSVESLKQEESFISDQIKKDFFNGSHS